MSRDFLLDTNVPSELTHSVPDDRVRNWVLAQNNSALYISAVSIGEVRKGISRLPQGKRRMQLEAWFVGYLLPFFGERIIAVTTEIAIRWGEVDAECQRAGNTINMADGMIAATALHRDLTVVTRNVRDFSKLGVLILNPCLKCVVRFRETLAGEAFSTRRR